MAVRRKRWDCQCGPEFEALCEASVIAALRAQMREVRLPRTRVNDWDFSWLRAG